jgi:hypothetical protein
MEAAANVLVIPSTRSRPGALDTTMITTPVNTEAITRGSIDNNVEQSPNKQAWIEDTGDALAADASGSSCYQLCS